MRKDELIKLAEELLKVEDLATRKDDLLLLKREFKKLNNREDENFYEKQLSEQFFALYDELAKKDVSLNASSYDDKKAIIAKAKELLDKKDIKNLRKEFDSLFLDFKHAGSCSKEQDDELFQEMKEIRSKLNEKINEHFNSQKEMFESRKNQKLAIIEEAKKALEIENIKQATAKFDSLLEDWKKVGFAGKECDEDLWKQFSEVRKQFSAKRKEYFSNLKVVFQERAAKKEEMISLVKKITADAYFDDEEVKKIKNLRNEWNKIGFSGKEVDDELYQRFNEAIQKYFEEMKFYK